MVRYRRSRQEGGTFFFTVTLRDRRATLLTDHCALLLHVMRHVHRQRPWQSLAWVVLPDHLHAIWVLPTGDADFSGRWRAIKSGFVQGLTACGHSVTRNARGESDIWQRRFWEHQVRDDTDLQRHADYIHFNPVKQA